MEYNYKITHRKQLIICNVTYYDAINYRETDVFFLFLPYLTIKKRLRIYPQKTLIRAYFLKFTKYYYYRRPIRDPLEIHRRPTCLICDPSMDYLVRQIKCDLQKVHAIRLKKYKDYKNKFCDHCTSTVMTFPTKV